MTMTPGIYCPTALNVEPSSRYSQEIEHVWITKPWYPSPVDSAKEIPQGFPSLQLFLILHNLLALDFIKAILACILQSLCCDSCVLRAPSNHYLELVFHEPGDVLNFAEVITLLSHGQRGRGRAVQLSCPRLVLVSTPSKISPSLQVILTHYLLSVYRPHIGHLWLLGKFFKVFSLNICKKIQLNSS